MSMTTTPSNTVTIKSNWKDSAKKLQAKFPALTDSDVRFTEGQSEDLMKRIETRLQKKREEVVGILKHIQE